MSNIWGVIGRKLPLSGEIWRGCQEYTKWRGSYLSPEAGVIVNLFRLFPSLSQYPYQLKLFVFIDDLNNSS